MTSHRRLQWQSSKAVTPISDLWEASLTERDPPNLALESGEEVSIAAFVRPRMVRRRETERTLALLPIQPIENSEQEYIAEVYDGSINKPYITYVIPSRRHLKARWSPAQTGVAAPLAAFIRRPLVKRRSIKRTLAVLPVPPVRVIAPPAIAYFEPPQPFSIEFKRTLRKVSLLLVFPPPTGPPQLYPAWRGLPFVRTRVTHRAHKRESDARIGPAEVFAGNGIEDPFITRRISSRKVKGPRWLAALAPAPQAPQQQPAAILIPPRFRRASRAGKMPVGGALVLARVQPQWPSYQAKVALSRKDTKRKLLRVRPLPSAPPPVVPAQPLTAWRQVAVRYRPDAPRRRLLQVEPTMRAQPLPAWQQKLARYRADAPRRRLSVPELDRFAPTPVQGAQPYTAWLAKVAFYRSDEPRRAQRVADHEVYPRTPDQPHTAWLLKRAIHRAQARRFRTVPVHSVYPASPAVGVPPVSSWQLKRAFWSESKRRLITSPAPIGVDTLRPPVTSWKQPVTHRIVRKRRLLQALAVVPAATAQPISATPRADAFKRRDTERKLRVVGHNPIYPQTPAPPQPMTAILAKSVFRRHSWRVLRVVPLLDEKPRPPRVSIVGATATMGNQLGASASIHNVLGTENSMNNVLGASGTMT